MTPRVILVTGGTSGVGLECCKALVADPALPTRVLLVGRTAERVQLAVDQVNAVAVDGSSVEGRLADLASLASVRELVNRVIEQRTKLFAIVCNAGIEAPPVVTSPEGFETTFATNHLGHFLLVTSLYHAGMFLASGDKPRIVILSSSLHSSEQKGLRSPDVSDWQRVAFGGPEWNTMRAYATSKLCNLFFGYEFQRRYGADVLVYMYSPGFMPDTGLFRNHSTVGWWIVKSLIKLVAYWRPSLQQSLSTPERSGLFLARLASDAELPWDNGSYFSIDHLYHSDEQSKDPELAKQLWELSQQYVDKTSK
jgi:NAD(P)-dependent dehydrogenase (short-subunit alcohol dehydrogenase family)